MNRSRIDIFVDILSAADSGAKKTSILYKSNLSYFPMTAYLKVLLENGLLEEKNYDGVKTYWTTDKGKKLVSNYRAVLSLMKSDGEKEKEKQNYGTFLKRYIPESIE